MRVKWIAAAGAGLILLFAQTMAFAGHLRIDGVNLAEVNTLDKTAKVEFDVSWDNSWKNDINCDAVWVFAKFMAPDGLWKHVDLKAASEAEFNYADQSPAKFSKGSGADLGLYVPEEKKGAFLFRARGAGSSVSKNAQLVWDYGKDGVTDDQIMKTKVKVFGVEMVYVAQDKHWVGDPRTEDRPVNCFYAFPGGSGYLIKSEDPILVDKVDGALYCDADNVRSRDEVPFTIPMDFPKGYKAFWIMKYELTSQQFVDFLNTLTRKQQQSMVESDISKDEIPMYYVKTKSDTEHLRNAIVCARKGNGTTEPVNFYTYAPARAMNYTSWSNITSYGDWAGLRPITELEFEKACLGPLELVIDQCAWGSTELGRAETFDGADGSGLEKKVPQEGIVNCCWGGGIAPFDVGKKTVPDNPGFEGPVSGEIFENLRVGGIPQRINDGASYYGAINLTGNCWERCVTVGHPLGRAYDGLHGDGVLTEDGFADVANWPGKDGTGAGNRGGVWSSPALIYLRVNVRFAANFPKSEDGKNSGCRLGY
ncbi:MAG: SUMF1/EgtB/PvdO family nonheme iron enzyme [Candidatus Omnitrophica bacterium]|nr:SUMF1/EgtB/PvdO family nonheme iron enzyme [Candidatus Omnitrophota bacterium]